MKVRLILLSFIVAILYSCGKDGEDLETFLVIGDQTSKVNILDTLITTHSCDSVLYPIDIDSNGIDDLAFYVEYCQAPSHFYSFIKIYCLHDKVKILTNDSIQSPEVLSYGDTLNMTRKWVNDNMNLLTATFTSEVTGGTGIIYREGNWNDLSNKYIGVFLENEDYPIFGWIKLSIDGDGPASSLTVHEVGYRKSAFAS